MNLRRLESLLLSPSSWLNLSLKFFHQFYPANLLYHLYYGCKLLRMTWSIVNRKLMNLRRLESLLLSPSPWLRLFCHLFYQFYHSFISSIIRKFLRMTWYIVDRKADEFRTSGILVDLCVLCCYCLSRWLGLSLGCPLLYLCLLYAWVRSSDCVCVCYVCAWPGLSAPPWLWLWMWLGCLLLYLCLLYAWVHSSICVCVCSICTCTCAWFVGSSVVVTVDVAGLSAPLSVSAVCLGLFFSLRLHLLCLCLCLICLLLRCFVCDCAWVIRSSVCVCYVPRSDSPSASTFAMCLCLCLVCRRLRLCLLCLWLCQKRWKKS